MNIYKAEFKQGKDESYWDQRPLIIIASSYGDAEDRALDFEGSHRELASISLFGETTGYNDIFKLKDRH